MQSYRSPGFTLVELLVVIAILAILFAIFMPSFHCGPTDKSRQTACINNQRQIAVAINMYVQDNNEVFFPDTVSTAWAVELKPYNEPSLYDCPSKTGKGDNGKPEYGFNSLLFGRGLAAIVNPAEMLLTADLNMKNPRQNYSLKEVNSDIDPRHIQGVVLTCVDGHVAYEKMEKTTSITAALLRKGYEFAPTAHAKAAGPWVTPPAPANGYAGIQVAAFGKAISTTPSNLLVKWDVTFKSNAEAFPGAGLYCSFFDNGSLQLTGNGSVTLPKGIAVGYIDKNQVGMWVGGNLVASVNTSAPMTAGTPLSHTLWISGYQITWSAGGTVVDYEATPAQLHAALTNGRNMALYLNSTPGGATTTVKNVEITPY